MVAIKSHIQRIMEEHVASCGFCDEDETTHLKEEVGPRCGNVMSHKVGKPDRAAELR